MLRLYSIHVDIPPNGALRYTHFVLLFHNVNAVIITSNLKINNPHEWEQIYISGNYVRGYSTVWKLYHISNKFMRPSLQPESSRGTFNACGLEHPSINNNNTIAYLSSAESIKGVDSFTKTYILLALNRLPSWLLLYFTRQCLPGRLALNYHVYCF